MFFAGSSTHPTRETGKSVGDYQPTEESHGDTYQSNLSCGQAETLWMTLRTLVTLWAGNVS
jgi:hypothetical protein